VLTISIDCPGDPDGPTGVGTTNNRTTNETLTMRSKGLGTNIAITLFRQGLGLVFALGLVALINRTLGPEGQGRYSLAIFLPTLIVLFSNLGVPAANAYFIGRGDVSLRAALATSVKLWAVLSVCGTAVGALVIHFFAERWFPGVGAEFLWIALAGLPFALFHSYLVSLLQGIQDFNRYNIVLFVEPVVALVLTTLAIIALRWGVAGALWAYVVAWMASVVAGWRALVPHLRESRQPDERRTIERYARRCVGYGWMSQVGNNLAFMSYRASILLINFFMSPAATGIYITAVLVVEKIWLLSHAASQVLLPRLSELHTDEARRRRLTPLATKIIFGVSLVVGAALFAAATPLMVGIFGEEFRLSVEPLRWLLPGVVVLAAARGVAVDLAARGRVDLNLYVAIMTVAVNIGGGVLLIPRYGLNGAAIATSASYLLNFIVRLVIYTHISGNKWYSLIVWKRADISVIKGKIDSLKGNQR
jgi:O-antigen/teichoic acid export membrane protein